MSFQKVENALRRANELQASGSNHDALQVLHETIMHSRFRAQGWDAIKEQVMIKFINFCVDMDKLKYIRDGLYQYRTISHQLNIVSLGKVIVELRDKVEEKFRLAKLHYGDKESNFVADLEAEESPEDLMLNTIQVEVRDSAARDFNNSLRFLWETYKLIMDILKFSPRLEKVYHDTARRACDFCLANQRTVEFKRLCDVLRLNYSLLFRYKNNKENENLLRPEFNLETRLTQLNVATELGLWREAAYTAEDLCNLGIHELFHKSFRNPNENNNFREKLLKWLSIYYEKLAKIFWVSENYLFHALAYLKYLLHIKHYKKNVSSDELQRLGTTAVLAVLSIPTNTEEKKFDTFGAEVESILENQKNMTNLLGHPTIPTRDTLKYIITHRDILEKSSDVCQNLFNLIESDFLPLKLCSQCLPLLNSIEESTNSQYITPIKKIIFHKLLQQLSKVFTSITIDYFTNRICPHNFYQWEDAENLIVNLVQQGSLMTLLDYEKKVIYFGPSTIDPVISMKQELSNLGKNLVKVVYTIYPNSTHQNRTEQTQLFSTIKSELKNEHERILKRKDENDKRRTEKIKEQEQFEERKKQELLKQMKKEEERKQQREQEEMKLLERQKLQKHIHKLKIESAVQLLEDINKIRPNLMINSKPLDEYSADDLLNSKFELTDIEKAFEEQFMKERSEKLKLKRLDAKKMDHLIRAIRQEELALLNSWKEETLENDRRELKKLQSIREIEYKQAYQDSLKNKALLKGYLDEVQIWIDKQMVDRQKDYEIASKQQIERLTEILKKKKIERARERFTQFEEAKKLEEIKKKKEEEEQLLLAEKERLNKLDQIASIQRQKEEEVEIKARGQVYENRYNFRVPYTSVSSISNSKSPTTEYVVNGDENGAKPVTNSENKFTPTIIKKHKELKQTEKKNIPQQSDVPIMTRRPLFKKRESASHHTNGHEHTSDQ